MLRQPSLSLLSATYQFIRAAGPGALDLWPSVRAEPSAALAPAWASRGRRRLPDWMGGGRGA
eukprot:759695-Pyramimonas_sp.AAC.1